MEQGYVVCVPGAAWPRKSWLPERYVQLFDKYFTEYSGQLVLLGGPKDHICDTIARDVNSTGVLNLKEKTDLGQALAVLSRARLVIGSDTGLLHAAEALAIPVIMILGPTSRETGAGVHHPDSILHENHLWCRPCSQNGKRRCYRREQYCLTETSAEQVYRSLNHLMGKA